MFIMRCTEVLLVLTVLSSWTRIINASTARGPPKILGRDFKPLQVVRVGQEFRVACPVEGDPSPNIDWFKDGEPITEAEAWKRFRVSSNSKALRIRSVVVKDSGVYECKGVNGFGSQIARTRLVVADDEAAYSENESVETSWINARSDSYSIDYRSEPIFTPETLEQAGQLHISSGSTYRFQCDTQGTPASKVAWFKDGKSVNEKMWRWSSWTLVLNKLSSEDSGTYTCRAINEFGKNEFSILLEITEMIERRKPVFAVGYPNNVTVLAGNDAVMECVVRAGITSIPPHIKWLKRVPYDQAVNDQTMKYKHRILPHENQHVIVIQEGEDEGLVVNETQVNGTFVSKLIFKNVEAGLHEGTYVCWATNSVGWTFKDAKLTVLAGAQIIATSSVIPFPLIVFGLSTAISILVIGSSCFLRKYQKGQQKQAKSMISIRQLSTPSVGSAASSYQRNCSKGIVEQRKLLVLPTVHSSYMNCQGNMSGRIGGSMEPAIEIALSRCSCCGDQSSAISAVRTYEHCYDGSYISSTSHSLHCGHWT